MEDTIFFYTLWDRKIKLNLKYNMFREHNKFAYLFNFGTSSKPKLKYLFDQFLLFVQTPFFIQAQGSTNIEFCVCPASALHWDLFEGFLSIPIVCIRIRMRLGFCYFLQGFSTNYSKFNF